MSDAPTLIAIAVVEDGGRFLVGVRPAGIALAGYSEFPGGKIEPDETPARAAVRECLEETGLEVEIVDEFPEQVHQYEHDQVRLLFFHCRPQQDDAQPLAPFRWVSRVDLKALRFPAGNDALLAMLQDKA